MIKNILGPPHKQYFGKLIYFSKNEYLQLHLITDMLNIIFPNHFLLSNLSDHSSKNFYSFGSKYESRNSITYQLTNILYLPDLQKIKANRNPDFIKT